MAINDNRCACPDPPGGYTVCSPRQLAICRIVDGKIDSLSNKMNLLGSVDVEKQLRLRIKELNKATERANEAKNSLKRLDDPSGMAAPNAWSGFWNR